MTAIGQTPPFLSPSDFPNQTTGIPTPPSLINPQIFEALKEAKKTSTPNLNDSSIKRIPISHEGVPICNNRDFLSALQDMILPEEPAKFKFLSEMCLQPRLRNSTSSTADHREETIRFIKEIAAHQIVKIEDVAEDFHNPQFVNLIEGLGLLSPSVSTLFWVHFALWGVSLFKCGTQKHQVAYLAKSNTLEIMGCLMMTEIGHGTNVLGVETTATYDQASRGFIINTPNITASKIWAGGTVKNANHGVLFARLIIEGKDHGVHAFIMRLRDDDGKNLPGITIYDLGRKFGLNGIDNGIVQFNQCWIPYDNLLDRYCEITPEGTYVGREGNKNSHKLIYRLMSQFVRGRQVIGISSAASLKFLSTIFYCYPPVTVCKSVHRQLLVGKISEAFALEFAKAVFFDKEHIDDHIRASLAKAVFSDMSMEHYNDAMRWYSNFHTSQIRNVLDDYYRDAFATTIYEGVNVVLLQLGATAVLKEISVETKKWYADLLHLKISAFTTAVQFAWNRNKPEYMLKWHAISLAKKIGETLKGCKDQSELFKRWGTDCQVDGILLAQIYTQILVIEEFYKTATRLDAEQKTTLWSSLARVYAWNQCSALLKVIKKPDLKEEYALIAEHVPSLAAKLGLPVKYIDALVTPPPVSLPFDTTDSHWALDRLFQAKL